MFRKTIYGSFRLLGVTAAAAAALLAASCSKTDDLRPGRLGADVLTLSFRLDGDTTRADGEQPSSAGVGSENKVESVDLFFYTDETAPATFAASATPTTTTPPFTVQVSLGGDLSTVFGSGTTCKVYAVANCAETKALIAGGQAKLTLDELKAATTTAAESYFRSAKAPESFVMTSFSSGAVEITCNGDYTELVKGSETAPAQSVELKRLAAKIRAAINLSKVIYAKNGQMIVKEEAETEPDQSLLAEGYTRWTPDVSDMRVYINNGVRKARLDGTVPDGLLGADGDYYAIATSGSRETEDFELARLMVDAEPVYADYPYYNETPLYTYPNAWTDDSSLDNHVTTLTIVVPWETEVNNETDDETTWRPTYYTVQVNNKEAKIEPNKYYYLRMHIGRMGGLTSLTPVELDPLECEILGWSEELKSEADLRPQRFLYFSEEEFVMNNEYKIEIPFASTHNAEIKKGSFKGTYYYFKGDYGKETPLYFNDNTKVNGTGNNDPYAKGYFYDYEIDTEKNILTFWQRFTEPIFNNNNLSTSYQSNGIKTRLNTGTQNLYTRFEIEFTIKHDDLDDGTEYEVPLYFTIYPAIFMQSEYIPTGTTWENRGWLYVNGYGTSDAGTGNLGPAGHVPANSGDSGSLTIFTISQFNEEEKAKWVIGDPRTYYINNNMSNSSMLTDFADQFDDWGDSFDGSQTGNSRGGECRTIWSYYNGNYFDVPDWSNGEDTKARRLMYYYPASEISDKANFIAPKLLVTTNHSYSADAQSRENARRRCATFQQYGYPAGRWRLPTLAEIAILKDLQSKSIILDIFTGTLRYWSNMGGTTNGTTYNQSNSLVRCVYDLWYWEEVDGASGRIPDKSLYNIFTWGDKPKQGLLEQPSAEEPTVESYLRKHGKGNYKVVRTPDGVKKLEKMN